MRLKSIKLAGFKSFVDPTTVNFPSNLSAVVGPNGCGKSNVIDAVRWVMGESSAKHLRGESMTDVIFNGSGGRKPVGQASIELLFDNSSGSLGGEYARYNEIAIRRKVTRDGTSNYYLNGQKCRRRDITDIFLGTGLGPRSYAIIEQGMISRLIEAKPDELRVYIEEAAGISKYKERRRDTENRIRRTKENLERLADIRDELGRQIQRLERQAQAAEKYAEFKKEERFLKAQLQALRWRELNQQIESKRTLITRQELDVEALVTERSSCDTALEKHRAQYTEESDRFNEIQGEFYAVGADVARLEQTIEHNRQRARELQNDIEQTQRNFAESEQHLRQDRDKQELWRVELEDIIPQLEELRGKEEALSESLQQAEDAMAGWQQSWDEFNQQAAQPKQQAEVQQSRIQHVEQVLRRLAERKARLEEEGKGLDISPATDEISAQEDELLEAEESNQECQLRLDDTLVAIEEARQTLQQINQELNQQRERFQSAKGRKASLDALQQAALEDSDDSREWLEKQNLGSAGRLAEAIKVEAGWEIAVETVLASDLQSVRVSSITEHLDAMTELKQGDISLFDGGDYRVAGGALEPGIPLSRLVSGVQIAQLDNIFAVGSIDEALSLQKRLQGGQSVITPEGLWLGPNWARVCRGSETTGSVLKRQQELDVLAQELAVLEQDISNREAEHENAEGLLSDLESRRQQLSQTLAANQKTYADLRSTVSASKAKLEQLSARRARLDEELADIREQYALEQEQLSEARQLLQEALDVMESHTQQREQLLTQRDSLRGRLDQARQTARHGRDRLHELDVRERAITTQLQAVTESISRLEVQVARLDERRQQLQEAMETQDNPSDELALQLEERLEKRLTIEEKLISSRRQMEAVEEAMREYESRRSSLEHQILNKRTELEQTRLSAQEISTRSKTIVEQITNHDYVVEELLQNLPEDALPRQWEESLEQIGNRIQRLGAINLAAIEEFKTESERKTYLDTQYNELTEALDTLENAIRKIDKETRTRFKETFDVVNSSLQELFPKVFGGGHAYLELTGEDLLDTGVTIMARPPGKKNTTIHLLSGGEKALTAIALVFSIFRLNPAPFCMLDEVDAPLDDANVGRYARLVEEMSATVQFIYITHNKIAMEMAQQLMGVTMHEPGVSRLVTVDVDKAVELAEA